MARTQQFASYVDPDTGKKYVQKYDPRMTPVIGEIAKAFQNDPRTKLAQQATATGTSTAPVAGGKWAMPDVLARALQGTLGGYLDKRNTADYSQDEAELLAKRQADADRKEAAKTALTPVAGSPSLPANFADGLGPDTEPPPVQQTPPPPQQPPAPPVNPAVAAQAAAALGAPKTLPADFAEGLGPDVPPQRPPPPQQAPPQPPVPPQGGMSITQGGPVGTNFTPNSQALPPMPLGRPVPMGNRAPAVAPARQKAANRAAARAQALDPALKIARIPGFADGPPNPGFAAPPSPLAPQQFPARGVPARQSANSVPPAPGVMDTINPRGPMDNPMYPGTPLTMLPPRGARRNPTDARSLRGSGSTNALAGGAGTDELSGAEGTDTLAGGTRAADGNNPGGIMDGAFARKQPGYVGSNGNFAAFKSPEDGMQAQKRLLMSYVQRGYDTPAKIAARWAPKGHGANDPVAYANTVAGQMGIGPNDRIGPESINSFAQHQARLETGTGQYDKIAGGSSNTNIAGGDKLPASATDELPIPAAEPMPTAPEAEPATKSAALARAYEIMRGGNRYEANRADELETTGLAEDTAARENAAARREAIKSRGYEAALGRYGTRQSNEYQAAIGDRTLGKTQRFTTSEREAGQGFTHSERLETQQFTDEQRRKAEEAAAALASVKNSDKRRAYFSTGPGGKVYDEATQRMQSMDETQLKLNEFERLQGEQNTGGVLAYNAPGLAAMTNSKMQRMEALTQDLSIRLSKLLPGAASDKEGARIVASLPSISKRVGANKAIINLQRAALNRARDFERTRLGYIGDGRQVEFTQDWDAFRNSTSVMSGKTFDEWINSRPKYDSSGKRIN